jgi:Nuclease-related domain
MCKTYNKIGSLTTLKSHLDKSNIYDFKSLKEVIDFQNSYSTHRQQIISHHENLIEQEKSMLNIDIQQLSITIEAQKLQSEKELTDEIDKLKQQLNILANQEPKNHFQRLSNNLRKLSYVRKIKKSEGGFYLQVKESTTALTELLENKSNRYQFIISQFDDAVRQSYQYSLSELDRKKSTIDELSSYIYGALGEQKVVKVLESLSDDYYLINDLAITFSSPIYNKQENEYIKSIQIDHVLIAPTGIFLIETKNWSKESLESLNLRSPVQQIKRTSFALFRLLNNIVDELSLNLDNHHWGNKKISIRNLIVFTDTKPKEEFQHVKILTLTELLGYINYFKPIFSNIETQKIADYLLTVNNGDDNFEQQLTIKHQDIDEIINKYIQFLKDFR